MLNGTVIGSNAAGALTLTGDAAKNVITVHQIGTNSDGGATSRTRSRTVKPYQQMSYDGDRIPARPETARPGETPLSCWRI